jgi:predicted nucleic acid-binding protein
VTVLPDTSIWVDYLRRGAKANAAGLDALLATGDAVMCGPVAAELLAGAADADRDALWQVLAGLPWVDLGRSEWRRVGEVAAALRRTGAMVALTDIEIAVASVGAGATLWSRDSDFERVAKVLPGLKRLETAE